MNVLLLCDYRADGAATVIDHIDALRRHMGHRVIVATMHGDLPCGLELDRFDAVIIHYSLFIADDTFLSPLSRYRVRRFEGLKAVFIQDEYRWVNRTVSAMQLLCMDVLFTCVPESEIPKVYVTSKLPGLRKVQVLTGYVPTAFVERSAVDYDARHVEVGYRGRKLSAWYGDLAQDKWRIGHRFAQDAARFGLKVDLSSREEDRLYGERWAAFVQNCKAVLGCESGASVFDFTGEIQSLVEAAEEREPDLSFETLRDRYFSGLDGVFKLNQISPRCFEAAALRTMMILYDGQYSDILVPWRHYVPLRKDHGNVEKVIAALRDREIWQRIVDAAYVEIACNPAYSYQTFSEMVGSVLTEEHALRAKPGALRPYADEELPLILGPSEVKARMFAAARAAAARRHDWVYALIINRLGSVWRVRVEHLLREVYRDVRRAASKVRAGFATLQWCRARLGWSAFQFLIAIFRGRGLFTELRLLLDLNHKVVRLAHLTSGAIRLGIKRSCEGAELCFLLRVLDIPDKTDAYSDTGNASTATIEKASLRADANSGLLLDLEPGRAYRLDRVLAACAGNGTALTSLICNASQVDVIASTKNSECSPRTSELQ